jgi:putative CocE/NonD family hydrolase
MRHYFSSNLKQTRVIFAVLLTGCVLGAFLVSCAHKVSKTHSLFITMKDDVKLAADVHLPEDLAADDKVPALLYQTRYWRSYRSQAAGMGNSLLTTIDKLFLKNGYAVVKVDVRGTGASYGFRKSEYGPVEVLDGFDIVEWIVQQPWSNGKVGSYGISYTGTTAEFLLANEHPAVKAAILGWSDFDAYKSPVKPYGMQSDGFLKKWSQFLDSLDDNNLEGRSVRPVDADRSGAMLSEAVAQHSENLEVYKVFSPITFRDTSDGDSDLSFHVGSSLYWREKIEKSGVAMFVMASWLDAGVADGALLRYNNYSNPQKLWILATSHGGRHHASPYVVSNRALDPIPSRMEQWRKALDFLNHYLKGMNNGVDKWPAITYFNLAEEIFKETDVWPPKGTKKIRMFMREGDRLSFKPPEDKIGEDSYTIDFEVTTGSYSRWMTQMGTPVLYLNSRNEMDTKMLTFTSQPLAADLQITGYPVITLYVKSTHSDGAFLVYLEDVFENGKSVYMTEGGLRAIHRKVSKNPYVNQETPYHSFAERDAMPLVPGEMAELTFELQPTSVLIKKGHKIRVAIAGADKDNFNRIPAQGMPTITVARNKKYSSFIALPVSERNDDSLE